MGNVHFVGLDPSLTATGLCVIQDNGHVKALKVLGCGSARGVQRLGVMRDQLTQYMDPLTTAPDDKVVCAIEGYALMAKGKNHDKAELGGAYKVRLYDYGKVICLIVPPKSLKMIATDNGNADKDMMIDAAINKFQITPNDDNEADALWLAHIARVYWHKGPYEARQAQAMAKVYPAYPLPFTRPKTTSPHRVRRRSRGD